MAGLGYHVAAGEHPRFSETLCKLLILRVLLFYH